MDTSAGVLHCPSCGAAISDGSTQCQYCHALLQTIACPSCFGMMFKGSKFCPHCGASALDPQIGSAVAHQCPLCQSQLTAVSIGAAKLEECISCAGIWVGVVEFNAICADNERQAAAMTLPMRPAPPSDWKVHYLKCPTCGELMNRTNYAHASGVIINSCPKHGIWFDHDGLRRVIEFIRNGGLSRARVLDAEEAARRADANQQDRLLESVMPAPVGSYYNNGDVLGAIAHIIGSALR